MNEAFTAAIGFSSGMLGMLGAFLLFRGSFVSSISRFLYVALQGRGTAGAPDLEFRKQQLCELYGPVYAYLKLNQKLHEFWMGGKLKDIDREIIAQFRKQNEQIVEILSTKLHLLEGDTLPAGFTQFITAVTLWNMCTGSREQLPEQVAALPEAQYPKEFEQYIFETTEHLKQTVDKLYRKCGITS
jgi:hypothetical protein